MRRGSEGVEVTGDAAAAGGVVHVARETAGRGERDDVTVAGARGLPTRGHGAATARESEDGDSSGGDGEDASTGRTTNIGIHPARQAQPSTSREDLRVRPA